MERLGLAPVPDRETDLLRAAATGVETVDLGPRFWQDPPGGVTAWRVPTGAAALSAWHGRPLDLAVAPPTWLCGRGDEVLGRRLAVVTVGQLAAGKVPFAVRAVKPATLKVRALPAQRYAPGDAVTGLPEAFPLLVADGWLACDSEYRAFCVGREVVTVSTYRVQDEGWSPELPLHRASWHERAGAFAAEVLADAAPGDVPPACVLDVARLTDGRFVLLETNTAWASGLYGCDPAAALSAVLAAQRPADPRWRFDAGPALAVG